MKGKVLKPHPNRSCDLMQLPCQNLSSAKLVGHPGGSGCRSGATAGGTAAPRAAPVGETGPENHPGTLGSQGWQRGVQWGKKERLRGSRRVPRTVGVTEGCSGGNTILKAGFDFSRSGVCIPPDRLWVHPDGLWVHPHRLWVHPDRLCSRGPRGLQAIAIADVSECRGDAISTGKSKLFLL